MSSVFVSHASSDDALVARLVGDLRASGCGVWVDQSDLAPGDSLAGSIQRGIVESRAFLLLLSKDALSSRWVELEWQAALSRATSDPSYTLLLVKLDDVEIPLLLNSRKWIDLADGYDEALSAIKSALGMETETKKHLVWYFDDSLQRLRAFSERHATAFETRSFDTVLELMSALDEALGRARLPDIVLLDLYCPRAGIDSGLLQETNRRLTEFFHAERDLKEYVDDAWKPIGVEIVESVRQFYTPEQLPIAMHTQQGLALLRDDLLQELETGGVGWLLKNRFSPETDRMILDRVIMQSGHRVKSAKQRVLIIDDNPKFLADFCRRHGDNYLIETLESQGEVLRTLSRLSDEGAMPDIFLVDMYYPRGSGPEAERLIELGNEKLSEFAALEGELRATVQRCYEPIGLFALKQIRRQLASAELPVLVYTQATMLMLGDEGIQEIERLGGGWLLKDRYDVRSEQALIYGEILRAKRARQGSLPKEDTRGATSR